MDILRHGKIHLRPLEPDDVDVLYQWENNIEIWEVSNTRTPFSRYILTRYIEESARGIYSTGQLRLIIANEEKQPVGAVDLFDFDAFHQRAGVGILIHNRHDRRKGYASDALEALESYATQMLGLKQLYANITADNQNSIALFEKQGFRQSGTKRHWIKTIDGWKDELFYQKLF